jgi:hypothetical protein
MEVAENAEKALVESMQRIETMTAAAEEDARAVREEDPEFIDELLDILS